MKKAKKSNKGGITKVTPAPIKVTDKYKKGGKTKMKKGC